MPDLGLIHLHQSQAYGVLLSYYTTNESFRATEPIEYAYLGGLSISCAFLISPRLL
ncbi:hypothetical protein EDB81DRAFT_795982 [Dactylonectria macrodidyma]|uniref:Uncharacterized protein n=1 Tax=Dactylonectria macrodidyma TaxID=307937 RepID=A0A9P9ES24_9HYPO|nr:hypothetical protein EDB81DRAFT_795982 [Dactylonectria macrodidyma]